jgi:steroid 5-alpha reductase family enzyme
VSDWVITVAAGTLGLTLVCFTALWALSVQKRNATVVDYYWAPGFVVIGIVSLALTGRPPTIPQLLVLAAVGLWAGRLGAHLVRKLRAEPHEDARYARFRAAGGPAWWWRSLPQVFWLQAVIQWIAASPLHAAMLAPSAQADAALLALGLALFAAGLATEWIADAQLARFRADPANAGRTCDHGLWAWSRRPNYLGEAVLWIGLGVAALGVSGQLWALAGPVVLTAVMFGVTGPLTEAHLLESRPDYAAYRARVGLLPGRNPARRAAPRT